MRIESLVEKPSPGAAPSRLAIAARYLLTPAIFDCLERTPIGKAGEVQLTDALRLLLEREPIHGVILRGTRHDIGNPIDWLRAKGCDARLVRAAGRNHNSVMFRAIDGDDPVARAMVDFVGRHTTKVP